MRSRRLLLVVVVLMGLTALAASVAPRDGVLRQPPRPTPTPTPAAPAAPAPGAEPRGRIAPVEKTITVDPGARAPRIVAEVGALVTIIVEGDAIDAVNVADLTDHAVIAPESPARIELLADRPGMYPITLIDAERTIGQLDVREPGS